MGSSPFQQLYLVESLLEFDNRFFQESGFDGRAEQAEELSSRVTDARTRTAPKTQELISLRLVPG
jgi:hypothetical protein